MTLIQAQDRFIKRVLNCHPGHSNRVRRAAWAQLFEWAVRRVSAPRRRGRFVAMQGMWRSWRPIAMMSGWSGRGWFMLNALQAMNHVGTLTVSLCQQGNEARVSIGDSGCGIPEAIRGKIFDVFFTTKPAGVGSGLGLDIVKKIIEKHQGRIELQSEVGIGTTFTVILPYQVT
jgi:hypothetical protein